MAMHSKISNLCDPDPPRHRQTDRRTDGRTDNMQSQYRALHYSASRGKNGWIFMIYTSNDADSLTDVPFEVFDDKKICSGCQDSKPPKTTKKWTWL